MGTVGPALPTTPYFVCTYVGRKGRDAGKRCLEAPVRGSSFCQRHWGKVDGRAARERGKAAGRLVGGAELILLEAGVEEETRMDILDSPREVDPGVLLIEEINRTAGVIAWLERKIRTLEPEVRGAVSADGAEGFIGEVEVVTTESGMSAQGNPVDVTRVETRKEVTHWWTLLTAERKHLADVTVAALRSGLEERRIRLAERSVSALEAALAAALLDLGLDPHNERVRAVVGAHMRQALTAGAEGNVHTIIGEAVGEVNAGAARELAKDGVVVPPVEF